uniref:Putative ovule protein n=1 Tax=Solanum chacoense TaxID=4108 RepID=A0A0V0HSC8_SOLCH
MPPARCGGSGLGRTGPALGRRGLRWVGLPGGAVWWGGGGRGLLRDGRGGLCLMSHIRVIHVSSFVFKRNRGHVFFFCPKVWSVLEVWFFFIK